MTHALRRRLLNAGLIGALVCLSTAAGAADAVGDQISIGGAVKTPVTVTVDDLKAFPADQIETLNVKRHVDDKDVSAAVRGVRLTAVLARAGLVGTDHNEWKHTVVLATASDGYQAVFSWPELFNTDVGAGTYLVFERDGKPLPDREGRIALLPARDTQSGPRSVRGLARLTVSVVKD